METEICNVAPPEWVRRSVEDVCLRVTSGGTPSRRNRAFYEGGVWPWVTSRELQDQWVYATEECITDEALASSSAKILPPNTILMALYGATAGQLGLLQREMTCNQACCAMVVDPTKADFRYLFYQLIHARPLLKRLATGAAQQNLSGQLVRSLRLPFAPLSEQRTIAHILGSLDDKIELNRRMSKTLESIAQAIFKSWFIDFDPVKAKMDGREPYGLRPEIADLFPSRLVESELGPIPEGWTVCPISDLAEVRGGSTPSTKKAEYWDGGTIPFATPKDLAPLSSPILLSTNRWITEAGLATISSGLLPKDTILLSSRAPIGYRALAKVPVAVNQGFIALLCRNTASVHYVLHWIRNNMAMIEAAANGTTFLEISKRSFRPIPCLTPPDDLLRAFDSIVRPLYDGITLRLEENRTLKELRDTLLPKLISGEIRVPDAERFLEVNT